VNGYRRLSPRFTLAPTSVNWRFEDRSAMVRVLSGGSSTHVENRSVSRAPTPTSHRLSALRGPGGQTSGAPANPAAYPALPRSLREALDAFRESRAAEELLGTPLKTCLTKLKESEASRFDAWCAAEHSSVDEVTEWEHREYFDAF